MTTPRLTRISKFLSLHLRHRPEQLGLSLEPGGWVSVDALLQAAQGKNFPITREELAAVVVTNDKQRFALDDTGKRIRANQGHSVAIDLQLTPQVPPRVLYHGTGAKSVAAIQAQGLQKMQRHHVHLSPDIETAQRVGRRHGKPVVFQIDTAAMVQAGFTFYCSDNGVWLVDAVPPQYLAQADLV